MIKIFFCLLVYSQIQAQNSTIDSLHFELTQATSRLDSLDVIDNLFDELLIVDLNKALPLAYEALLLAEESSDKKAKAIALNNMGKILWETADRPYSYNCFIDSEILSEELHLQELQALNLMSMAKYHRYSDLDSAKTVNYFLKSLKISEEAGYHWGTGRSYAKLASFYTRYNEIELCENYLERAAEYYMKLDIGPEEIAHYYNEVGDKIWDTNPLKSMDLYFTGLEYSEIPNLMVSLAKAYSYIGNNETALEYLKLAIPSYEGQPLEKRSLGIALAQLAEVFIELEEYDAADQACDKGIDLIMKLGKT